MLWVSRGNPPYDYLSHRGFFSGFEDPGRHTIGLDVGGGMVVGLDIEGNLLFAADYYKGVFVFDISDPLNLKKIAHYRTRGYPRDIDCEGNFCYVADSEAGLMTINLVSGKISYSN